MFENSSFLPTASSTTELRPALKVSNDATDWTIEEVVRYITDCDPALASHTELFRKHVSVQFASFHQFLNGHLIEEILK